MSIDHIIVHHIEKQRGDASTLNLREEELAISPAAEHLLEGISSTYDKRTGKAYGQFQTDSAKYPFSDSLASYLRDDTVGFAAFTRSSMENLQAHIDEADWATGGYVVFILYSDGTGKSTNRHLMVVMLNDRRGTAVDDDTLEISDVTHLVLDELHLAARIDITAWLAKKSKHLSFVKGRSGGATVSRYFREFLGCAEYVDARPQTRLLIGVTESYIETQNLNKAEARVVKKTVYDHTIKAHADKKQVSLADISQAVDPERPRRFSNTQIRKR